jgi:hypothetical protein
MSAFYPMAPYMVRKPIDRTLPVALRSIAVRKAIAALPNPSRLRRALMFRAIGWFYRRFNDSGQIPALVLAPDVQVEQTAALFDTAGSFHGHAGFEAMLQELRDAFDDVRFIPLEVAELPGLRLYLRILFEAKGRGSGIPTDRILGHIVDLDERLSITGFWIYWNESDALEAAGLSE